MARSVYQLKVTLQGVAPPVWRRILVSGGMRLSDLHVAIQIAMGWTNTHLYQFELDGGYWGDREFDDPDTRDAAKVTVARMLPYEKAVMGYTYDFGDDWRHRIVVEKILPDSGAIPLPYCVTGKRACPPEDIGGTYGYRDFLEALRDPGQTFNPEAFDPLAVNEAWEGLFSSKQPRKTSRPSAE